jgi:hypothetical protein
MLKRTADGFNCVNEIFLGNSRGGGGGGVSEVKVQESEALSETSLFQSKVFTFPSSHTKFGYIGGYNQN